MLEIACRDSKIRSLETDQLILEFNSIELQRSMLPEGLSADSTGYLQTDSSSGLFVAGDCGGPPFSAVVALGEGVKAGFQAYQYVHQYKYRKPAPLFAYYGDPGVTDNMDDPGDFPLNDELVPVPLVAAIPDNVEPWFWEMIDGKTCLGDMVIKGGIKQSRLPAMITALLKARAITFAGVRS